MVLVNDAMNKVLAGFPPHIRLTDAWPHNHFHVQLQVTDFLQLPGFQAVSTLEGLLTHYKGVVMAVGDICLDESEGLKDRFWVPVTEAKRYYQAGAALEFDFAHMYVPDLRRCIAELQARLQLPAGTFGKAIAYAAPRGGGLPAHFDAYSNFIFQISGEKVWKLRENENVHDPVEHYDQHEYPYVPDELRAYWSGEAPDARLSDGWIEVLRPGSLMFLPRGIWHKTESSDATLSINITFSSPTYLDAILAELRRCLVADARWRAFLPRWTPVEMTEMLKDAARTVGQVQASDLLSWQDTQLDAYQVWNHVFRQTMLR